MLLSWYGLPDRDFHQAHLLIAQQQPEAAYPFVLHAIQRYESRRQDNMLYFTRMLHAFILQQKQLNEQALKEYTAVMAIGNRLQMPFRTIIYADVGLIHFQLGHLDTAFYWYQLAERQPDFSASPALQRSVYNNLAISYLYQEKYLLSETYHRKSLAIKQDLKDTTGIAESYLNLGDLYFDQYQNKRALIYWQKCLALARQLNDIRLLELVHYNLSAVWAAEHRYKAALDHYRQSVSWKDSLWNRDKVWTLAETRKQLAVQEKQARISRLEQAMQQQALESLVRKKQRDIFLLSCLGLLLLIGMVILMYRQKVKVGKVLNQLNQTKDRLFSIIAHDMRAPLIALSNHNNELAAHKAAQENSSLRRLASAAQLSAAAAHALLDNLLYWSFSETDNLLIQARPLPVKAIVEQAAAHLALQLQHKQMQLSYHYCREVIAMGDSYTLKIIFRNLIQNAIKFSFPGQTIDITIRAQEGNCCITIRDRGIGIPETILPLLFSFNNGKQREGTQGESGSGLGLWLCYDFIKKNKGSLTFRQPEDGGTIAIISLPLVNP